MYVLNKKKKKYSIQDNISLDGFECSINGIDIVLVSANLIDAYANACDGFDFDKFVMKVLLFLDGDDEDTTSELLLGELAYYRSIFLNKYAKYISKEYKDNIMDKIRLLAGELKRYNITKVNTKVSHRTR